MDGLLEDIESDLEYDEEQAVRSGQRQEGDVRSRAVQEDEEGNAYARRQLLNDENFNAAEEPQAKARKVRDITLQDSIQQLCQVSQTLLKKVDILERGSQAQAQSVDEEAAVIMATNMFQTKAFEKQFAINTKALCYLRRPGEANVKEAMKLLSERNAVLKLADKNPKVLQIVDAREATLELEALSKNLSKEVRDLITNDASSRKRRFPEAGNFAARGFTGAYQGSSYGQSRRAIPSLLDINVQASKGRCYSCNAFGHYSHQCPTKKYQARRRYW